MVGERLTNMEILSTTLGQMVVLFLLILIGFLLAKLKAVPENTAVVLSKLENNLFVPALVMGTFVSNFTVEKLGDFDTEMFREFFYAVSYSAAMNLHLKIMDGGNNHHMAEALFKAFGKALDMATMKEPRIKNVWSTKGSLA